MTTTDTNFPAVELPQKIDNVATEGLLKKHGKEDAPTADELKSLIQELEAARVEKDKFATENRDILREKTALDTQERNARRAVYTRAAQYAQHHGTLPDDIPGLGSMTRREISFDEPDLIGWLVTQSILRVAESGVYLHADGFDEPQRYKRLGEWFEDMRHSGRLNEIGALISWLIESDYLTWLRLDEKTLESYMLGLDDYARHVENKGGDPSRLVAMPPIDVKRCFLPTLSKDAILTETDDEGDDD